MHLIPTQWRSAGEARRDGGSCFVTEQQCHQVARMRRAACFVRLASNIGSEHEAQVNLMGIIWAGQGAGTGYFLD